MSFSRVAIAAFGLALIAAPVQAPAYAQDADDPLVATVNGKEIHRSDVIEAAKEAHARGCTVIGLTGRTGGALKDHADHLIAVPADNVSRIQEIHALCLHAMAETLEPELLEGERSA